MSLPNLPSHYYAHYAYDFKCSECNYYYEFREGAVQVSGNWKSLRLKYFRFQDQNCDFEPKLSHGWCFGCDRYVVIASPSSPSILYRYEREANELEELRDDFKLPVFFSILNRFGRRKSRLEEINQKIQDLHLNILNYPGVDKPDRCLYCGSENTVEIPFDSIKQWFRNNYENPNRHDLDLGLRHNNCSGRVTISEKQIDHGFSDDDELVLLFDKEGRNQTKRKRTL